MHFGRCRNPVRGTTISKMSFITRNAFNHLTFVLKYKDVMARMSNIPGVKQLGLIALDAPRTNLTYIPIYQDLDLPPGTVAPINIIEQFIESASYHVILNRCPCRSEMGCKDYEPTFGCTFVGEGARQIDPAVGRHVTKSEALEHLHHACEMGLVSLVGKFKGDAIALGVRDHSRLMTICHCCPCCCVSTSLHLASREARDILVKLEGLSIEVGDGCAGCGKCVEVCMFKQMSVVDGKAVVGEECKGCGRCAMACKQGAVKITLDNADYMEQAISRISGTVEVG